VIVFAFCGLPGWAFGLALTVWVAYASVVQWRGAKTPRNRGIILAAFLAMIIVFLAIAVYSLPEQLRALEAAFLGWRAFLRTAATFLGSSLGPAADQMTVVPIAALGILTLIGTTLIMLTIRRREQTVEPVRYVGLLAFVFGIALLAAAIGGRLAGHDTGAANPPRLTTLAAIVLCWLYLTWDIFGGPVGRIVMLTTLCGAIGIFFSTNALYALRFGESFRGKVIETMPGLRQVSLPITPAILKDVTWKDGVAQGHGADPQMIFVLDRPLSVYAVRMTYAYTVNEAKTSADHQVHFRMAWKEAGRTDFGDRGRNVSMDLDMTAENPPLTIVVNDAIDQLRIQPDIKDCQYRLQEVILFVRE
jgi:hypothetical protein